MLHKWLKVKKYLPLVSQKFMNEYLGIYTNVFKFPKLWHMMIKNIL